MRKVPPRRVMPGDGAVCPATVTYGLEITRFAPTRMVPETSKMMTRGPLAASASRREPGPALLRLVTRMISPPRPARVVEPKPCAPGKAGRPLDGGGDGDVGGGAATTVIAAVSLIPSLSAKTFALPAVTPVTRPLPATVATRGFRLVQVMARPVSVAPPASRRVVVSCTVLPDSTEADAGVTVTVA